jgi:hypothetical protein
VLRRSLLSISLLSLWGCPDDQGFPAKECGIVGGRDESEFQGVGLVSTPTGSCTGTLIAPRVVVTAQHCFEPDTRPEDVGFVTGRLGERLEARGIELFYVGEFVEMRDENGNPWQWVDTEWDFTVVALDRDPTVEPIAYRRDAVDAAEEGSSVDIVGYGTTAFGAEDSGRKRSGSATLSWVGPDWLETERRAGEASGCYGDSGGPLFLDGEVVGVFSYFVDPDGELCEAGGQYVRLDRFMDLIDEAIAAATAHEPEDSDDCLYANDGFCDDGTVCYPGTDVTDCGPSDDPGDDPGDNGAGCACDDQCAHRGDCCDDCGQSGACEAGYCVEGDQFCDEDMSCCDVDPDCSRDDGGDDGGGQHDPNDDVDPRDDDGRDPRDDLGGPQQCDVGLCEPDDGWCDEMEPCCDFDPDCGDDC